MVKGHILGSDKSNLQEKRKGNNQTDGHLNLIFYAYDLWNSNDMLNVQFQSFSQVFKTSPPYMKEPLKKASFLEKHQ